MHDLQNTKFVALTPPGAILDNTSPTTVALDTKGFDYARVVVLIGATDIALTALKLQESDTTSDANTLSSGADISGCVYGTSALMGSSTTSSLPSATDDNKFFVFHVPLDARRKRYIDLTATIGDGAAGGYITAWAELYRAESVPNTSATRGVGAELIAA